MRLIDVTRQVSEATGSHDLFTQKSRLSLSAGGLSPRNGGAFALPFRGAYTSQQWIPIAASWAHSALPFPPCQDSST